MRTQAELRAALREAEQREQRLLTEINNLQERARVEGDEQGGIAERVGRLNTAVAKAGEEKVELEAEITRQAQQLERIASLAGDPANREAVDGGGVPAKRPRAQTGPVGEAREAALRAIERRADDLTTEAVDMVDSVIRRDRDGLDSRYLEVHSRDEYRDAFTRILSRPQSAQWEMTREESEALRAAAEVSEQRAMAVGTPSAGGYGLPIDIDPTIALTSDGQINPLREVARVRQITTSEWRGVSSAGVTSSFGAEATEVGDDTPTLAQPTIIPERATSFVPFSFEVSGDYPSFSEELGRLFADAKDTLEAEKFVSGAGHASEEPQGIITGATGTVAAGTAAYAIAHLYSLQEALAPRFQPRARFLSSLVTKNRTRQFDTGDAGKLLSDDEKLILGKPWHEVSDMATALTAGSKILLYGDIAAGFEIVDRIGMSVELVSHLFGGSGRPTGQRGLLAWWRTSSGVVAPSALKVLVTT